MLSTHWCYLELLSYLKEKYFSSLFPDIQLAISKLKLTSLEKTLPVKIFDILFRSNDVCNKFLSDTTWKCILQVQVIQE